MDVIDALEHLGEVACWDVAQASGAESGRASAVHASIASVSASVWDVALLRALEGERLHGYISPAEEEEEDEDDEGAPEEEGMSALDRYPAG
jgi:hypothetical protein